MFLFFLGSVFLFIVVFREKLRKLGMLGDFRIGNVFFFYRKSVWVDLLFLLE